MKYYYQILQISPKASTDEIKKAFRTLALKFHPDKVLDPNIKLQAAEKFKEILEAYEVLNDPQKRQSYDEELLKADYCQRFELMQQQQEQLSKHTKQPDEKKPQSLGSHKTNDYINAPKDNINSNKRTSLHNAIIRCLSIDGDNSELYQICNLIIGAGVDINARDEFGKTALYYAVAGFNFNIEIIKLLLQRGALPNIQSIEGNTPLHVLLGRDFHLSCADLLISYGADLNIPNKEGKTPFHCVIKFHCNRELIESFIRKKANLSLPYFNGKSLLYTAIQFRSVDLIAVLLKHGAKLKLDDDTRENFINMVKSLSNNAILQTLMHHALQLSFPELNINAVVEKRCYVFNSLPPAKKQNTDDHFQSVPNPAVVNGTFFINESNQGSSVASQTASTNLNDRLQNVFVSYRK